MILTPPFLVGVPVLRMCGSSVLRASTGCSQSNCMSSLANSVDRMRVGFVGKSDHKADDEGSYKI